MIKPKLRSYLFAVGVSSLALLATPAMAQQVSGDSTRSPAADMVSNQSDGGEIIVTAQKRSERINDVPLSITASSGSQLLKQGVVDTAQLAKLVPGFSYQQGAYGAPLFSIRGVGFSDRALGSAPAVSVYV